MESFILYGEWERHFALLPSPQRGELIMAVFAYANRMELPLEADPAIQMAFSFIQAALDENSAKYEETKAAKSKAGRAGGLAKASKSIKASVCQKSPSKSSLYVSVSDSVSVSESISLPPSGGGETREKKSRFTPPTIAEISSYVAERHSAVDPQEFYDFYASKGWVVGKAPMKDWKAACRNAEKWDRWKKQGQGSDRTGFEYHSDHEEGTSL